jgi:hypothetical protein
MHRAQARALALALAPAAMGGVVIPCVSDHITPNAVHSKLIAHQAPMLQVPHHYEKPVRL